MSDSLFSAQDYTQGYVNLLPRGKVWPKSPGSSQYALMSALALTAQRLDARAQTLLVDAFPATTVELLPEWELTLGLPDPCDGPDQTVEQRQAHVISKFVNAGGQSKPYFLGVLARLGYPDATITEYAPFRADIDHADGFLYDETWIYHWTINLPELSVYYFEGDVSFADEFLETVSDGAVECVLETLKPAHTTLDFTNNP